MAADNSPFVERQRVALPPVDRPAWQQVSANGQVERTINGGSGLLSLGSVIAGLQAKPHVTRPYQEIGWIYSLVRAFGQAVASVPLDFWDGDPAVDKQAKPLPQEDPLVQLMRRPNPHMSQAQLLEAGLVHRKLEGEDFWIMLGDGDKPIELSAGAKIPVPRRILCARGSAVTIQYDSKWGWPTMYRVSVVGGQPIDVPPSAVITFRDYNPDDPRRGLGAVEVSIPVIELEHQADRYQRAILANSGDPGGYIIRKNGVAAPEIGAATENQIKQQRAPTEAGKWKQIDGDVEYQPYKIGPREMDFPKMRERNRDYFAAIVGCPLPIIGVLDHATLNNTQETVDLFWNGGNGVMSHLRSIEDVLNNSFLPNLNRPDAKRLVARFNTKVIKALQEDKVLQLEAAVRCADSGRGISMAAACQIVGLELDPKLSPLARECFSPAGLVLTQDVVDGTVAGGANDPNATDPNAETEGNVPADDTADDPADEGKAAIVPAKREAEPAPAPTDAEVAASARRSYWQAKESSLLRQGEKELRSRYRGWRKDYERATYARIRAFAMEGDTALRQTAPAKKATDDAPPLDDYQPDVGGLLLPKEAWGEKLGTRIKPGISMSWSRSLNDLAEELGRDLLMSGADPSVIAAIRTQVTQLVDGHLDFLGERVGEALSEALSKATNHTSLQEAVEQVLPEITENLKQVFGDRSTRAATIARTETARSVNGARFMGMKQAGVSQHEWVTSHDAAVRGAPGGPYEHSAFSHYELDGKQAAIGFAFEGHSTLKFPGDPDAPAGDTVNCRCVARPVIGNDSSGDQQ